MDLAKIRAVLLSQLPADIQEKKILDIISEDGRALEYMLFMLDCERKKKKELVTEMNVLLSQSETLLEPRGRNKDRFMNKKIIDFYKAHKETSGVFHCFCTDIDKK